MSSKRTAVRTGVVPAAIAAVLMLFARTAWAHCDTLDGPVVAAAREALEKGDVMPVLMWVQKENKGEIREAFRKTLAVRTKGPEARDLADMYFFETLVRLHRAGEGAPYSGLKPAGTAPEPGVQEADKALETGEVNGLVKQVSDAVAAGIRQRFTHAVEAKKHARESVEAGRKFTAAYVEFVHYVERLLADAAGPATHHGEAEGTATQPAQHGQEEKANPDTEHHH